MKYSSKYLVALALGAIDVHAATRCEPHGCYHYRSQWPGGGAYHSRWHGGAPYGCAWVNGAQVCR
jgi:hypothetical protein